MDAPLLTTKLYIPTVRPDLVARPRLVERLSAGPQRKLTLISAPAGFGKTTLLSEWVAGCEQVEPQVRIAWLSLDEGDNDPARFWAYVVAALRTVEPGIGEGVLGAFQAPRPPPVEPVLTALINQIAAVPSGGEDRPCVLVLDDYHLITAPPIHDALAFFLDHLPPTLRLVIATRADPPLPLARLRARAQLTELRQTDLRFTAEEAAAFLNTCVGLDLSAEDVAALEARTEGWIAGLQMAAVSMRGREDAAGFIRALTGSDRHILDYLGEEVLQRQPESIQTFLLRTSILDRLSAPLCDALLRIGEPSGPPLAGSQATLEYLDRNNLFVVPLDNERRWYRYHRLFADLLRRRLQQSQPELVPVLHGRASEWHERSGLPAGAIDHALAASDFDRAAHLIEQVAEETLKRGEVATFLDWTDALPDELLHAHPALCVLYAWMQLWQGQSLQVIESLLRDAEEGDERVSGRVTALRGLIAGLRGQMGPAIELSRRALAQLPEDDSFVSLFTTWLLRLSELVSGGGPVDSQPLDDVLRTSQRTGNVMLSVMIGCNYAEILMREGQLHQAAAVYREALDLATDVRGQRMPIAGQASIGLGELAREWGDLDAAERYLLEGIELTEQWSDVGPLEAYITLARLRWAQGRKDEAWEAIQEARELAVRYDVTNLDDLSVGLCQARMWVAEGDLESAQRWAEGRDLHKYVDSPLREEAGDPYTHRLRKYELLVLARLLIAQERADEALKLLDSLVALAKWRWRPGMLIEIHALQALAHQKRGDTGQALDALQRALSMAEPEGYARVFLDEGEPMATLLREAASRGAASDYAHGLLAACEVSEYGRVGETDAMPPHSTTPILIDPLSPREREVLHLISQGLSNKEIAEELVISLRTVKWHASNIYGKLGVKNRTQAVAKARSLGVLPVA